VASRVSHFLRGYIERAFPEQRIFLRSETETKFIRLGSLTQATAWVGSAVFVGWAIIATAIILMDSIGSGSLRDQAAREQRLYEQRLNTLSTERDMRAQEASDAQERFNAALSQISTMQTALLESEERLKELETGIDVIQTKLSKATRERNTALEKYELARAELTGATELARTTNTADADTTLDFLTEALHEAAEERDSMAALAAQARLNADELAHEKRLLIERNNAIFTQLEDAVNVSLEPLDKIFSAAGLNSDSILSSIRRGYSGQGGPTTPLKFSSKGEEPSEGYRFCGRTRHADLFDSGRCCDQRWLVLRIWSSHQDTA